MTAAYNESIGGCHPDSLKTLNEKGRTYGLLTSQLVAAAFGENKTIAGKCESLIIFVFLSCFFRCFLSFFSFPFLFFFSSSSSPPPHFHQREWVTFLAKDHGDIDIGLTRFIGVGFSSWVSYFLLLLVCLF